MEPCRVSSMKSSEYLLVDCDCLLENLKEWIQTVCHWKMMGGSGSVIQRCMSLQKRFPSPCISAGKMPRAIIQVVISKTFCVIFFHESCGRRYSPILTRAHFFSIEWVETTIWLCFFLIPPAICYTSFCRKRCGPNPQSAIWRCEIGGRPRNFHSEVSSISGSNQAAFFFLKMPRFFTRRIWPGWPHLRQKLPRKNMNKSNTGHLSSQIIAPSRNLTPKLVVWGVN